MRCLSQFLLYTIHLCSFNAIRVISRWKIKEDPNLFSKEKGSDFLFLAACPAAQQKHPQRMAGLLQLRRSALRMLIFMPRPLS